MIKEITLEQLNTAAFIREKTEEIRAKNIIIMQITLKKCFHFILLKSSKNSAKPNISKATKAIIYLVDK